MKIQAAIGTAFAPHINRYFLIADHRAEAAWLLPLKVASRFSANAILSITIEQKIPYRSPLHDKVSGENYTQE